MEKKDKEPTYSQALAEIEAILTKLNNDNTDIDMLAADVKRATGLIRLCRKRLLKAEEEVNEVLREE